jgi:hypothetical protein
LVLQRLGKEALDAPAEAALVEALQAMVQRGQGADGSTAEKRQQAIGPFVRALAAAEPSDALPQDELAFWRQYAASLLVQAQQALRPGGAPDIEALKQGSARRDAQMARNLIWLAREAYPNRKIIVWAASAHVMRGAGSVKPVDPQVPADYFRDVVTMGEGVWKELAEATYTLGFIAAEGETGRFTTSRKLTPAPQGSLEDLLVAAGLENSIVDFRHLDERGAWLRERIASAPLGYVYATADWTSVFDGVVFTRTMYPSTPRGRTTIAAPAGPAAPRIVFEPVARGWAGPRLAGYQSGIDKDVKHAGQCSFSMKSVGDEQQGFGNVMQVIAADAYRGKRLRMSGFVRSEDVAGWAGLWMRVDGRETTNLAFDNMQTRPIKGTGDWQEYEIVLDLPDESAAITFGALLVGKGRIWIDDLKLQAVGQETAVTSRQAAQQKSRGQVSPNLPKAPDNLDFEQ